MFTSERLKRRVIVHVTFIKIGEINTPKEVFEADILVRSKWREPTLDKIRIQNPVDEDSLTSFWNPKVYIDNVVGEAKVSSSLHLEYNINGEAYLLERKRFKGVYLEHMELWEFPFDTQDLSITVMSDMPSGEVQLTADADEVHKIYKRSFLDEQEFYLYKYMTSEQQELQKDRADPFVLRSVLVVRCCASRRFWCFVWNHFAVMFLIACLGFLTFSVPGEMVHNRLQLSFTLMLTTVAFKFVVGQNLPKISYLTYMDRYVLATITCLSLICVYHGTNFALDPETYPDKDYFAMVCIGGAYLLYNLIFVMRLFVVPLKQRRELKHEEVIYSRRVKEQAITKRESMRLFDGQFPDEKTPLF